MSTVKLQCLVKHNALGGKLGENKKETKPEGPAFDDSWKVVRSNFRQDGCNRGAAGYGGDNCLIVAEVFSAQLAVTKTMGTVVVAVEALAAEVVATRTVVANTASLVTAEDVLQQRRTCWYRVLEVAMLLVIARDPGGLGVSEVSKSY